jgi:hypothetical protein
MFLLMIFTISMFIRIFIRQHPLPPLGKRGVFLTSPHLVKRVKLLRTPHLVKRVILLTTPHLCKRVILLTTPHLVKRGNTPNYSPSW